MAVVPICYKIPYHDHVLQTQNTIRQPERGIPSECSSSPQRHWCFRTSSSDTYSRILVLNSNINCLMKTNSRRVDGHKGAVPNYGTLHFQKLYKGPVLHGLWSSQGEDFSMVCHSSGLSTTDQQLRSLETYLEKVQGNSDQPSSDFGEQMTKLLNRTGPNNAKDELERLNSYLGKLNEDTSVESYASSTFYEQPLEENLTEKSVSLSKDSRKDGNQKNIMGLSTKDVDSQSSNSTDLHKNEVSDLYLIGLLASINIAVFLFEIASPIKNSEFGLFTLPLVYGAKINDLILSGEWWRLVTPMFLHGGAVHVALGCWSLLTFGPLVCRGYGSFTFFLIYILGGFYGNLISFLHTPEPSVGGTGPIFSIIGAWLVYQNQNEDVITKEVAERMFQKAAFITAASFILSHFGLIDDWTHLGAVLTGIVYGFFTCPSLQMDDAATGTGQDEGIRLVGQYADPCKSLFIFSIFVLVLCSLLFVLDPPLETIALDDFCSCGEPKSDSKMS